MIRKILIIISLALCAASLWAQQVTNLSLADCRRMAIDNNAKVKISRANTQAATEVKREAYTHYFPTVEAQGLAFWANKPVLSYNFDNIFSLGIMKKGYNAGVYAMQPVFAGGRIINGNKLAQVGVEAGRLEEESAVDEVALTAEKYYWDIVTLKSKKQTLNKVIQMVDTLQQQVSVAVQAGVAMRNDLLKVQLKRNEFASLMVDLDNGITLSTQLLAQYIGLDGQPVDVVMEDVPGTLPPFPSDIYTDPHDALANTVDYRLLGKQVEAAQLQVKIAAGQNMPTVGVGGGLFYDDLLSENHTFGAVFLSVNVPISGWWNGDHSLKKSKVELSKAQLQREDLSQMLVLNMKNNWDNLTAAYRKLEISYQSIAQATENLRLNQNYYKAGVTTVTELLDAQTLYQKSTDAYMQDYGNFRLCRAKYLDATGRANLDGADK